MNSSKLICFLVFAIYSLLEGCNGQSCASVTQRIGCGDDPNTQDSGVCTSNSLCCYDASKTPHCYINTSPESETEAASRAANASANLPEVSRPENFTPVQTVANSLVDSGNLMNAAESVTSRTLSIGTNFPTLIAAINFPQCAVRTPFCYRTRCNKYNAEAEYVPEQCLTDPSCCFDRDLFLYRAVFGDGYMGGAPVCYYGPTSFRYRAIAQLVQPYNAYFQSTIVDIFQQYLNTGLNFEERAICLVTNAVSGIAGLSFANPMCGWDGITELECYLKGCCFNTQNNFCSYPSKTTLARFPNVNTLYPEFESEYPGDETCPRRLSGSLSPNTFRRLPCRPQATTATNFFTSNCPRDACCGNILGLIPNFEAFNTIQTGSSVNFNSLGLDRFSAILLNSQARSVNFNEFFCPFLFLRIPNFPDLTSSVRNCCRSPTCYHLKEPAVPSGRWGVWGQYTECNAPCGATGTQSRQRTCLDRSNGNPIDSRYCGVQSAREIRSCTSECCLWTPWENRGSCVGSCGTVGRQERVRYCRQRTNFPNSFPCNNCPGQSTSVISCQSTSNCGTWTVWRPWGTCQAACGSTGQRTRTRSCTLPGGQQTTGCSGVSTQTISCQGTSCCSWTGWEPYGSCDAQCGQQGSQTRSRSCRDRSNRICGTCPGSSTSSISCTGGACYTPRWSSYSECSSTCTRYRYQYCYSGSRAISHSYCGNAVRTEQTSCTGGTCVRTNSPRPVWGQWLGWSPCSTACGGGTRFRERPCLFGNTPTYVTMCSGGNPREEQSCATRQCGNPQNQNQHSGGNTQNQYQYSYGSWSNYGPCDATCGTASRTRSRLCYRSDNVQVDASYCAHLGPSSESTDCSLPPCDIGYTNWSSFSPCTMQNNGCNWTRVRCPITADNTCPNPQFDTQPCTGC